MDALTKKVLDILGEQVNTDTMELVNMHISWGPSAANLTDDEKIEAALEFNQAILDGKAKRVESVD